jgi:hypothetical protein
MAAPLQRPGDLPGAKCGGIAARELGANGVGSGNSRPGDNGNRPEGGGDVGPALLRHRGRVAGERAADGGGTDRVGLDAAETVVEQEVLDEEGCGGGRTPAERSG